MRMLQPTLTGMVILALLSGVAGAVVAQSDEAEGSAFPTGSFVADDDGLTLELGADGSCLRNEVPCTYGVKGNLYSEMSFDDSQGAQVPATYYWDWDGAQLTFEPWATDLRPDRQDAYAEHVYRPVGETQPLPAMDTSFPTGAFVAGDDSDLKWWILANGKYDASNGANASYVVNGDMITEMAFSPGLASIALVPATYHWLWDGERLSFRLWGEDANAYRKSLYLDHTYVRDQAVSPAQKLLLSHLQLDVWVSVEIRQAEGGGYEVTATVDGEPLGVGVGDTKQEAVKAALEALGEPYASDMAATVKG